MKSKEVLVTVGTTRFDKLIQVVTQKETLNKLHNLGYSVVHLQTGLGTYSKVSHNFVNINYYTYIDDFISKIRDVDLVISHAGAGTCLEVLKEGKPLIVVVNEDLMDNHQIELAEELQKGTYVYFCTCNNLLVTLSKDIGQLKKYPKSNPQVFSSYLNKCMGFT
ncbi:UDP-N-acetylglucosamine transferase subunit ALG13 homolog [Agrilus planipennis]|uniref:UDP-N-acetylglucosamine transferase subunit ALG13 n=1 Tax=Agrilus planipennis TaxID=224129 RepID=A0A1W4X7M0_AGRPL|nr:UDP-N-acetylglucosamine transferase subunit ALG13 homolog [Agrilus planipennis]XP_025829031.1 UDP-N-acetylglucosamine transferase subunit ALG13 homolog [Agrilus planipennis]